MSYLNPQTPTQVNVAGTTASVALFAPAGRVAGRTIYNDSAATLYVSYGPVAAGTTCTTAVASAATYTFPAPVYGGTVTGVWASGAGTARTTAW